MHVVTPRQMRKIDKRAIEEFGIPGILLMENAAIQTYRIIENLYSFAKNIFILAGCGNNGGDGLALARILYSAGKNVKVIIFTNEDDLTSDAKFNFEIVEKLGIHLSLIDNEVPVSEMECRTKDHLIGAQLIVDALFGTGLSRPLEGHFKIAVDILNDATNVKNKEFINDDLLSVDSGRFHDLSEQKKRNFIAELHNFNRKIPVISLDIPSGINGENGSVLGTAILASDTVTFGYPKRGHFLYPGKMHTGRLHVVPISLPPESAESVGASVFTMNERDAALKIKKRLPWGHKGTFGKVAVIAGSAGMTGAACLTSSGALRSGAGIVMLAVPSSLNPILENKLTEVMTYPLKDTGHGSLDRDCIKDIPDFIRDKDVLAIGPGLGKEEDIYDILEYILTQYSIPIVLDADGLNHISKNLRILIDYKAPVVITPHPGEMARLTGTNAEEISSQPVEVALSFAKKTGAIVLLKGATSVVATPQGEVYINKTGNCGMATAGSGDVLTGIIAGLIAQKYEAFDAAVLGAFIHGLAGDEAACETGQDSLVAGDILKGIPFAINILRSLQ